MKKTLKKFLVTLLSAAMVIGSMTIPAAAEGEEYELTLCFGGDKDADGDWGYGYTGPAGDNTEGIEAVNETIKVGETKTVSITLPSECLKTWYTAPMLIAENVTDMDVEVWVKLDGVEYQVDPAAGDSTWWYEGTGNYSGEECIRLYGGYNEWATQYLENPVFTTLEYEVTLNSITVGAAEVGESVPYDGTFDAFIAFGADKDAEGDWGWGYAGGDAPEGITAVNETIAVGETKTVSLTLDSETIYTWYIAPVLIAEGISDMDVTVSCKIDGNDADIDFSQGDAWWYEGTGDFSADTAIRLAGGYNEWGAQFIPSPKFTSIEYTITVNSAMVAGEGAEEAPAVETEEFDANGTYNAYIGFQTPKYSFRNSWNDATYGKDTEYFNQVTGWDAENNAMVVEGTMTDAVIAGNGTYTVSATGLAFPAGEFDSQDYMNLIFVSTDMPRDSVEISDVVLKVNGSTVDLAAAGALISPEDNDAYVSIMLQNIWNSDITTLGYYSVPVTSIEVTFTVNGFAYDAAPAEEETTEEETAAPAEETTEETATEETKADDENKGSALPWIIGGAVVVVAGGAGAGVAVSKKKKGN